MVQTVELHQGRRTLATVRLSGVPDPVNDLRLAWLELAEQGEHVTHLVFTEQETEDNGNTSEG